MTSSIPAIVYTNGTAAISRELTLAKRERDELRREVETLNLELSAQVDKNRALEETLGTRDAEISRLSKLVDSPRDSLIRMYITKNQTLAQRVKTLEHRLARETKKGSRAGPVATGTGVYGPGPYPRVPIPVADYPIMYSRVGFPEYVLTMYAAYGKCQKNILDTYVRGGVVTPEFYTVLFSASAIFPVGWFDRQFSVSTGHDLDYFCWKLVALRVTTQYLTLLNTFSDSAQLALKTHVNQRQLFQTTQFLRVQQQQFVDLVNIRSAELGEVYTSAPPLDEYTKKRANLIAEAGDEDLDKLLILADDPIIRVPAEKNRKRRAIGGSEELTACVE
ncbi:ORF24 [Ictalurid herpesvirus 1]|uniref:Uncharacterized protein ORF24 n=1 Tax=Ictalurid herpesvirus 1 (strain Auburn) TaxID=766178 RepID=VG24_ICHVA|nr:ORF24 [Ictalurid herpesvirus 1]Q00123.1 RecName: Full=Uncharacterized protein ORF24 [Ictalurid herpesvirus 1 (strain Auburn)]AAA88127.1 ORF24 [Ictalurid herpesvirus 1]